MKSAILFPLLLVSLMIGTAQNFTPNYDESKIPDYELANPLTFNDGSIVESVDAWKKRRSEILQIFENEVYGKMPEKTLKPKIKMGKAEETLDGKAIRKEVFITFKKKGKKITIDVLMYLPKSDQPVPVFLGCNFYGNHTIWEDDQITLAKSWVRNNKDFGITNNRATEASRGVRKNRWAVDDIIDAGYGLVTIYYGDIDPDFDDDFENGIHALFAEKDQPKPAEDEWGSIGAWAWGLSRTMDYLLTDDAIDGNKVAVFGHSRLGKAALWAGATDERFALVISNNSGCGGAALSKRRFGETVGRINRAFPHWFCDNFTQYNENEDELPVDQHLLISLMAPRPVYIASASEDQWADPKGEFLSGVNASPVYELLGKEDFPAKEMPELEKQVMGSIGYHIRNGKHDVTPLDWKMYVKFANKHFE